MDSSRYKKVDFSALKGVTLLAHFRDAADVFAAIAPIDMVGDEVLYLFADNGDVYALFHERDCCEVVSLEDIDTSLDWVLNHPILLAEESTTRETPEGCEKPWADKDEDEDSSFENDEYPIEWEGTETWTFYRLSTVKGSVTMRWYGTSNGYYSEAVSMAVARGTAGDFVQVRMVGSVTELREGK